MPYRFETSCFRTQAPVYPNYNLVMTNEHPEWVLKYAKYVVPSLPENTRKEVQPYLLKHQGLLQGVYVSLIVINHFSFVLNSLQNDPCHPGTIEMSCINQSVCIFDSKINCIYMYESNVNTLRCHKSRFKIEKRKS